MIGELKLNLKHLPPQKRAKFVKDIENEPSSVLYLMKFSKKEERDKNLRLLRGVVVTGILAKDADNSETITLQV